jgi:superfamily II DNA/RNA helicase
VTLTAGNRTAVHEIHPKETMAARTSTSDRLRGDTYSASIFVTSDASAHGVEYPDASRVIQNHQTQKKRT